MSSKRVASIVLALAAAVALLWIADRGSEAPVGSAPVEPSPRVEAPARTPEPAPLPRPREPSRPSEPSRARTDLPPEAYDTLSRIKAGGPFRHRQDGGVFGNYEGRLPKRARGYYHEFTVETPGSNDRGARRIITGGDPPVEYFYTSDHYQSFLPIEGSR